MTTQRSLEAGNVFGKKTVMKIYHKHSYNNGNGNRPASNEKKDPEINKAIEMMTQKQRK
jgi:hypothetical protein